MPLRRVQEVSLASKRNSTLWESRVGANSNPEFWALDDDLLPDVSIEHTGAIFVPTAGRLVDRLEHRSGSISADAGVRIGLAALD